MQFLWKSNPGFPCSLCQSQACKPLHCGSAERLLRNINDHVIKWQVTEDVRFFSLLLPPFSFHLWPMMITCVMDPVMSFQFDVKDSVGDLIQTHHDLWPHTGQLKLFVYYLLDTLRSMPFKCFSKSAPSVTGQRSKWLSSQPAFW